MLWYESFDKKIADYLPDLHVEKEEPLSRHSSFRIGGPARRMAFPTTPEQLVLLQGFAAECEARPLLIGNGTNMLFPDKGLDRLVINTRNLDGLELSEENENSIIAQAGVSLAKLANFACTKGFTGLEFAHGIPGSVGGGVCMNAGAYGGEIKDVLLGAAILFPEEGVKFVPCEELALGYRHSILTDYPDAVVLSAVFRLQKGDRAAIRARMDELMAKRKASQPLEFPSAGSTFKRPAGYFAGALIEQANLKGLRIGDAQVSEKHAGFVINCGHATGEDVRALIKEVQKRVKANSGVVLEPEVKIIDE